MHKHHYCGCKHQLAYCNCCDTVYCIKCGKEWTHQVNWSWINSGTIPCYTTIAGDSANTIQFSASDATGLKVDKCSHRMKKGNRR